MGGRVEQLLLERGETPAQHVGFGRIELRGQPIEPRAIRPSEEHLHRRRLRHALWMPIMIGRHESWYLGIRGVSIRNWRRARRTLTATLREAGATLSAAATGAPLRLSTRSGARPREARAHRKKAGRGCDAANRQPRRVSAWVWPKPCDVYVHHRHGQQTEPDSCVFELSQQSHSRQWQCASSVLRLAHRPRAQRYAPMERRPQPSARTFAPITAD